MNNSTNENKDKYAAQKRYDQKMMKQYAIKCHNVNDYDIIEFMSQFDNKSDTIKKIIRYYIENNS